jgi:DNA-binding response OmpR family regulator
MPRILIAEDDSAIRQLLITVLQRHGFTVETAADGNEALRVIAQRPFDLLLLDLMMPTLSGWKVIEELDRLQHPLSRATVIITAASDKDCEALSGRFPMLRKPFDLIDLLATVRRMTAEAAPALLMPPSSAVAEA